MRNSVDFDSCLQQDLDFKQMIQQKQALKQLQKKELRCQITMNKSKGKLIGSTKKFIKKLIRAQEKWPNNQEQHSKYWENVREIYKILGYSLYEYLKKECELQKQKCSEQEQINSFLEALSDPSNKQLSYQENKIYIIVENFQTATSSKFAKDMLGLLHIGQGYIVVEGMNLSDIQQILENSKNHMTGEFQIQFPYQVQNMQPIFLILVKSSPKEYTPYQYKEFIDSEPVKVFFSLRKDCDIPDILRLRPQNNIFTMQDLDLRSPLFQKLYWYNSIEESLQQQTIIYQFSEQGDIVEQQCIQDENQKKDFENKLQKNCVYYTRQIQKQLKLMKSN